MSQELLATIKASPHPDAAIQRTLLSHDWQEFTQQWRNGYMVETRRLASVGNPNLVTVDSMHMEILHNLVSSVPHLNEAWDEMTLERLNNTWHHLRPWDDTVQGLRELKRQFKIGTLTNGNLSLMVDMAKNASLEWDFILTADLLGSFKPDAKMYRSAMRLLGIDETAQSHKAVMVAAHLHDLEHAKSHGMGTVFVRRSSEDELDQGEKPIYVDVIVDDLEELARVAGGLPMV